MIVQSLLDTDHHKITMDQVIFFHFPRAEVRYRFISRSGTCLVGDCLSAGRRLS